MALPDLALRLLHQMMRIRAYEEAIAARYGEWKMRCPVHLSVGQEAVAAAAGCALTVEDLAVSTHRSHAHYLGKGGSGARMVAELYGKATGCCGGRGGSMHLIDRSVGFKGSTAIVGNTIPVGVGLGLALKLAGAPHLACVFLGDAAVEEGVFFESASFAALKRLPVLFLCENNLYSVYSGLEARQPKGRRLFELASAIGVPGSAWDGNDALGCWEAISQAAALVRAGEGPRFLEFATYRWREHCGPNYDNDLGYRSPAEFETWKARDPIPRLVSRVCSEGWATPEALAAMEAEVGREVAEAFRFAEESPWPDPAGAGAGVYCEGGSHA